MGRLDDKIITIRFNPREYRELETVLTVYSSDFYYYSRSNIIKRIIRNEYNRIKENSRSIK